MKTTTFRSSWLTIVLAGALVAPAQLQAQRADSVRTHVVRPGDTLWNLAATYLGEGSRWREILALNTSVREAHSLTIGDTIRIPRTATRQAPVAPAPGRAGGDTLVPTKPAATPNAGRRTIFYGLQPAGGFMPPDSNRIVQVDSTVPAGVYEALSAPFVGDSVVFAGSGRCLSAGLAAAAEARGVQLNETLSIQIPRGAAAPAGSRWLLVRRGPVLFGLGDVGIPTGVVRLTSNTNAGVPGVAEVVAQFDVMSCDDMVLAIDRMPSRPQGSRTPVTNGARGLVAWVANESLLPSLTHALILDIGAAAGVRLGDRVTIYAGDGTAVVASADVVRVTTRSATVLVVRQSLPSLAAGLPVRVTEKLP
jgi:hypothetical protein